MNPSDILGGETAIDPNQKLLPPPTDTRIVSILCDFDFTSVVKVLQILKPERTVTIRGVMLVAVAMLRKASVSNSGIETYEGLEAIRGNDGTLSLVFIVADTEA